jgi:hypothetical protein
VEKDKAGEAPMLRLAPLTAVLALLAPQIAFAQSEEGHVYQVSWYNAHTGQEGEYSQGYWDWARPVFDELVRQGALVSYLDLSKDTGTDDSTHMLIFEYANWAALDGFQQKLDAASVTVLGYPYGQVGNRFDQMRDPVGSEIFVAPPRAN